jgi:hypothetical protein
MIYVLEELAVDLRINLTHHVVGIDLQVDGFLSQRNGSANRKSKTKEISASHKVDKVGLGLTAFPDSKDAIDQRSFAASSLPPSNAGQKDLHVIR